MNTDVISLCTGAGGLDLGFERAGFRTVAMCEVDSWRRELLAARFPSVPCWPDLTELQPAELPRAGVLIGGTPCQDLSGAGLQAGLDGDKSSLYWDYQRIRLALGIEWAVWENVEGALSSNRGLDFAQVLAAFVGADVAVPGTGWADAGVATGPWGGVVWRLLDAQYFGVPQRRRRVFVVGHLGGPCPPEVLLEPARGGRSASPGPTPRDDYPTVAATLTRGSSSAGVSAPGRRKEDDANLAVVGTLYARNGRTGDTSADAAGAGHLIVDRIPRDADPGVGPGIPGAGRERVDRGVAGTVRTHQRPGSNSFDLVSATPHANGVRATDGLAGWVDRSAFDPKPDGRRYAACGDGVVAPVAEWIGRRLMHVCALQRQQQREER